MDIARKGQQLLLGKHLHKLLATALRGFLEVKLAGGGNDEDEIGAGDGTRGDKGLEDLVRRDADATGAGHCVKPAVGDIELVPDEGDSRAFEKPQDICLDCRGGRWHLGCPMESPAIVLTG